MTAHDIDLDALEQKALAADQGVWSIAQYGIETNGGYIEASTDDGDSHEENVGYIAAANPAVVLELIRRVREAQSDLRTVSAALAESRANDAAAMGWLADCRIASGDHGKRMLPEFVEYLRGLKAGRDRYEKLRKLNVPQFQELYQRNIRGEGRFDDLVDGFDLPATERGE